MEECMARKVRLVNLSPHPTTIIRHGVEHVIPPSGQVARVQIGRRPGEPLDVDGLIIPVEEITYGEVVGLPAPEDGVVYLASRTVTDLVGKDRPDVLRVGFKVRDKADRIVGACDLATAPRET
jgi:hypothetical protein